MNARIPALLLALALVALPAPSQAQAHVLSSCLNGVSTMLVRIPANYAAATKLTEEDHTRYKTLHAAVRPAGSTMADCRARRADLVALETALAEMIAAPKAGDRLRGGLIVQVTEGGKHGLVAYPQDQPGLPRTSGVRVAGMSGGEGVQSCNNLVGGGFSDWYLPSYDELVRVWKQRAAIGHFRDNWDYWTSTIYIGNPRAYTLVKWNGGTWGYRHEGGSEIGTLPAVRCVRKF